MATTSSASSSAKPLVDAAKMPKMKLSSEKLANINAFASAFAIFFGIAAIFSAIAGFTKGKWSVGVPFIGIFFSNASLVSNLVLTAIFALCAGIIAIMTVHKLTDAESVKKAYGKVACVTLGIAAFFAIEMVATAIYSLMTIGANKTVNQGTLWLSNFLPQLIMCANAVLVCFLAKQIAAGKTEMLRLVNYLALGIAILAFLLVFIQSMVNLYGKKSSSSYLDDSDYSSITDLYKSLLDD